MDLEEKSAMMPHIASSMDRAQRFPIRIHNEKSWATPHERHQRKLLMRIGASSANRTFHKDVS